MNARADELDGAEFEIASFFREFPDDRIGVKYLENNLGNYEFRVDLENKPIGRGKDVLTAITEARKTLAVRKVAVLATMQNVDPNDFAAAVKRAANYATDEEMAELLSKVRNKIPITRGSL